MRALRFLFFCVFLFVPHLGQAARPVAPNGLSIEYLREAPTDVGQPKLTIGWYNREQGLFAGYQATSGKRLLFRTQWEEDRALIAEVVHLDAATGRTERLIGPKLARDADGAAPRRYIDVVGVDLVKRVRRDRIGGSDDQLAKFMRSEAGQAFSEGVPALYAALEDFEDEPRVAELQAVFGSVLTMLQIHTGIYNTFPHAAAIVGNDRANALREACRGQECAVRGKHFFIHKFGLFDTMSKPRKSSPFKREGTLPGMPWGGADAPGRLAMPQLKNGDGFCTDPGADFGMCGPGDIHPGDISTPECFAHDLCVCRYGTAACIYFPPDAPPDGDSQVGDLIDAIGSFLDALFGGGGGTKSPEEVEEGDFVWW
jgi:hypothetical protein